MNDYKELAENLRDDYEGWGEGRTQNFYEVTLRCKQAADAIEQLVKERDDEREATDEWRHRYLELARKCSQLEKERDAAAADLKFVIASACDLDFCLWCKHREFDGQCHHDCIPYSEKWGWKWRGAKMDEVSE